MTSPSPDISSGHVGAHLNHGSMEGLAPPARHRRLEQPIVIVGAGTIGRLMACEALLGGASVHLVDRSMSALEAARSSISAAISAEIRDEPVRERIYARFSSTAGELSSDKEIQEALGKARCVIEALPEQRELKQEVLCMLDALVPPSTPITTVSSSFPVRELLSKTDFPERFINSHPLQRGIAAIEIMPSLLTSREVHAEVSGLFESIGMVPVQVQKENVGFIFNIVWRSIKKTALDLVERGINRPEDLDRIWMMAFKTKNAPFALMDLVGLDVVLAIEERYAAKSGDPSDAPPPFLKAMVARGELGVKSGKGFYSYPNPAFLKPGFLEPAGLAADSASKPIRDTLVGSWELVSFTARHAGSNEVMHPFGKSPYGKLIYTQNGDMSVALVRENRAGFSTGDPLAGSVPERAQAFSEFFSYVGAYRYRNGVVYHDVEHCSFPNWSGCTLMRNAELNDEGHLILSTIPVEVGGSIGIQRLEWRRRS